MASSAIISDPRIIDEVNVHHARVAALAEARKAAREDNNVLREPKAAAKHKAKL